MQVCVYFTQAKTTRNKEKKKNTDYTCAEKTATQKNISIKNHLPSLLIYFKYR